MACLIPTWRAFSALASDAEAASLSPCCFFSLATLEVGCITGTASVALTEREQPGMWRWSIISTAGAILENGREPTEAAAKIVAAEVLRLAVA